MVGEWGLASGEWGKASGVWRVASGVGAQNVAEINVPQRGGHQKGGQCSFEGTAVDISH